MYCCVARLAKPGRRLIVDCITAPAPGRARGYLLGEGAVGGQEIQCGRPRGR